MKVFWCVMGLLAPFGLQARPAPGCELVRTKATSTAESDAIRALLSAGNFDALDAELERRLQAHNQGRDTDLRLYRDLDLAVGNGPEMKGAIHRWAAARPRSFFANLMAAMYHVNAGFRERGTAFADKTSQAQFEAMQQAFSLAVPYSNAAMALNPQSALPHTNMLPMAGARVGYSAVNTILSEGLLADPGSIAARSIAMPYFAPRWGGSFGAVSDLVRRAEQAKLPAAQIHYLKFSELMEQGSHWWRVDKAPGKALDAYRLALLACPNSERAMDGLLANASALNDWRAVIDAVTLSESAGHVSAKGLARRGLAHEKQGDMARAVKDYQRAVALGDAWATGKLGHLHLVGKDVPKDWVRARTLLTTAVSQGNTSAQRNLDWLNRQTDRSGAGSAPQPGPD